MKKYSVFYLVLLFLLNGCNSSINKSSNRPKEYDYVLVKYSDSSFRKSLDSLYIKGADTLFYNKQFPIHGFFKIFDVAGSTSEGRLEGVNRIGKWEYFQNYLNKWRKSEEHNYNNLGKLNGQFIIYDIDSKKQLSVHQYISGKKSGIQQDFYPSGKLHIEYEKDPESHFINTYVVFIEQGKELFKVDLGVEGSGYIKFYDKDNHLEWEGRFVNKKKQGWHKEYISNPDSVDKPEVVEKKLYKDDSLQSRTRIFLPWENAAISNMKVDSAVYKPVNGKLKVTYYRQGSILKKEEMDID